jgi:hypothetical protein
MFSREVALSAELGLVFAIKSRPRQRLNSHYLFVELFAKQLAPTFVILLEAGTVLSKYTTLNLNCELLTAANSRIAAVSGDLRVREP